VEDENQEAEDTLAGVTVGALRNFLRQVCGISNVSLHDGDRCCPDALVHYVLHSAAAGNQLLLTMSWLQSDLSWLFGGRVRSWGTRGTRPWGWGYRPR